MTVLVHYDCPLHMLKLLTQIHDQCLLKSSTYFNVFILSFAIKLPESKMIHQPIISLISYAIPHGQNLSDKFWIASVNQGEIQDLESSRLFWYFDSMDCVVNLNQGYPLEYYANWIIFVLIVEYILKLNTTV